MSGWQPREALGGDRRDEISESKRKLGPVPGTVEIASEHEIDSSVAVPGTAMGCGGPYD